MTYCTLRKPSQIFRLGPSVPTDESRQGDHGHSAHGGRNVTPNQRSPESLTHLLSEPVLDGGAVGCCDRSKQAPLKPGVVCCGASHERWVEELELHGIPLSTVPQSDGSHPKSVYNSELDTVSNHFESLTDGKHPSLVRR